MINELYRILKPNGILILSTLHPDSWVLKRGKSNDDGSWDIVKESKYDNRKGLTLFCPKNDIDLENMFYKFKNLKFGYVKFNLFLDEKNYASRLIYAKK